MLNNIGGRATTYTNMQAGRDENNVTTMLAVLNTDGETTIAIRVNPANRGIFLNDGTTGTDNGPVNDKRDENFVPTLMAVSSADFSTPVALYANSDGELLVDSS